MANVILRDADGVVVAYGTGAAPAPGQHAADIPDAVIGAALSMYRDHPDTAGVAWDGTTLTLLADDPAKVADRAAADAQATLRAAVAVEAGAVDPATVSAALARLDAIIGAGSVPPLSGSPTNADVVAQVRTLTSAANQIIDAVKDLARIERAVIRLLT